MTAAGTFETSSNVCSTVAFGGEVDVPQTSPNRPKPDSVSVRVSERMERRRRLLWLDAREPDHLAPLFRFISDVFAKVGARAREQHSTA